MNKPKATLKPDVPKHFRRLKSNELVTLGDFVANERKVFELWDGPNGFLAESFIKPIYRTGKSHSAANKKE
jgi:hypothetical protein